VTREELADALTVERFTTRWSIPEPKRRKRPGPVVPIVYMYDDLATARHRQALREACGLLPLREAS
jgi:hypothetical protein